ncbi:MAG: type I restriction enzyme HsdR N-terminal domain-containing protein [Thermodesulfovibrionales bacterium]|nr:type I restriction enzyme HsdR N-terminal domain-containing protein [Thermodesulfovibrionales bacterium]
MEDREKLIREKIAEKESIEQMQLLGVKHIVYEILTKEKGFYPEDIQIDPQFVLILSTCEAAVGIDFVINFEGTSFMVIRCVSSGIESWERYVIAFARAIKDYQIPYAAITDGEKVKVFDIVNDSLIKESIQEFFTRQEADSLMKNFQRIPCPENRIEKEKRIIYTFEGIKCPSEKQGSD